MILIVVRGASRRDVKSSINLDRVEVEGVNACVHDFVLDTSVTQKSFFSESGVVMLKDAVAVADSVIVSGNYNPWSVFGDGCNQLFVSGLQPFQDKVVMRRNASRNTSERCFGAQRVGSPSTGASAGRSAVQISNIVEEARVEYVAVPEHAAGLSRSVKSCVIGSKSKASIPS